MNNTDVRRRPGFADAQSFRSFRQIHRDEQDKQDEWDGGASVLASRRVAVRATQARLLVVERVRKVLNFHSPGSAQTVQPANVEFGSFLPPFAPCFESGKGGGKESVSQL
jgi:hypothetical protein